MKFKIDSKIILTGQRALPSVKALAVNAARSMVRNVAAMASGNRLNALSEVAKERLNICAGCEFFRASDERCSHPKCGCFLKLKTWLRAEKCPEGKW